MSALRDLLDRYRDAAATNREAGTYFEELTAKYLRTDPKYASRYRTVVPYAEFAARRGLDRRDAGIDLVAETFTGELDAVQCKLYAEGYQLQKSDIDSFFTASGKDIYSGRVIVATTSHWSEHAEAALEGQSPPVTKIDLHALEESPIDWSRFAPTEELVLKPKKRLRPHQENAVNKALAGFAQHERGKLIMASPPTRPAASSRTPTTTPPRPWATRATRSRSCSASSPSASRRTASSRACRRSTSSRADGQRAPS